MGTQNIALMRQFELGAQKKKIEPSTSSTTPQGGILDDHYPFNALYLKFEKLYQYISLTAMCIIEIL